MTNLRMTVSIRRVGKFQRDKGLAIRPIESAATVDESLDEIRTDQRWQKLAQDRRLVVPSQVAGRRFEYLRFGDTFGAAPIDQGVVRVHEREVHLRHQHVRVIPRISDDRRALTVAQHVATAGTGQELGRIVQIGRASCRERV